MSGSYADEAEGFEMALLASIHKEPKEPSMVQPGQEVRRAPWYSSSVKSEGSTGSSWRPVKGRQSKVVNMIDLYMYVPGLALIT